LYCPSDAVSRLSLAAFMNRLGDAVLPPNVLWVAPAGGTFQSIQSAIDHAATIATLTRPVLIKVAPGTYHEAIRLTHHVRVEGSGQSLTTIKPDACNPAQPGAVVMAVHSQIVGLTITMEAATCATAILFDDGSVGSLVRDVSISGIAGSGVWMRNGLVWGGAIERVDIGLRAVDHAYGVLAEPGVSLLSLSDAKIDVAGSTGSTGVKINDGVAQLTRVDIFAHGPGHPDNKSGIDVTSAGGFRLRESIVGGVGAWAIRRFGPPPYPGVLPVLVTYTSLYGEISGTGIVCLFAYDPITLAQRTC
jgi:hypothetical protein